ncbi:MAG: hypothetical protein PGN34_21860 [Methylobacterium frigidaeris]
MRTLVLAVVLAVAAADPCRAAPEPFRPFSVSVTLSPKARDTLVRTGRQVRVAAMYGFRPPERLARKLPDGEIVLGRETVAVGPADGTARLVGRGYDAKAVRPGMPGERRVLINVHTSDGRSDNLLDCGIFEGTLAEAAARPIGIACKLIGED